MTDDSNLPYIFFCVALVSRLFFYSFVTKQLFYISLTIGIILVTGAFINEAVPHMDILYAFDGSAASYPFSVFNSNLFQCVEQFYMHISSLNLLYVDSKTLIP